MDEQRLDIVYADDQIVVVNKPGGILAVPGRGPDKQFCIVALLKQAFPGCIAQPAVHRLDMATSGLMVLALTRKAHRVLGRQFCERLVTKKYIAVLEGRVAGSSGEIILKFRLDPLNRPWQVYDPVHGKAGHTRWRLLELRGNRSRVEFVPLTGRTHQIRVHAAHALGLGCPIVGDSLYGTGRQGDPMLLHAAMLSFFHPETKKLLNFHVPVLF
jgi:tRNA pseudouridine32 synthase/23S rRNA pseudouridine746 synthase